MIVSVSFVLDYGYYRGKKNSTNVYKYKVKTNTGKQSVSFMEDIWKDLPSSLKDFTVFAFPKYIKRHLLAEQKLNHFIYCCDFFFNSFIYFVIFTV